VSPDRRWLTKQYLVLGTIILLLAMVSGITHVLVAAFAEVDDMQLFTVILWGVAGGMAALMLIISVPAVILWFHRLEYVVEDDKIIIRKGILTKIQQNIPMAMVTDFRLRRTLYDRFLGIGSIQIQTAGQSTTATGYEGKLAGLLAWSELHEDLRRRIKRRGGDEPAGLDDSGDVRLILEELREIRHVLEASR